jgi:hypothetical protein
MLKLDRVVKKAVEDGTGTAHKEVVKSILLTD